MTGDDGGLLNSRLVFSITITDKGGVQRRADFAVSELTIGRVEDNELVLAKSNVSKQHARLVRREDRFVLEDLGSTNGTYVNGRKIGSPVVLNEGDKVYIGDFILALAHAEVTEQADADPARGTPVAAAEPATVVPGDGPEASDDLGVRETFSRRPSSHPMASTRKGLGEDQVRPSAGRSREHGFEIAGSGSTLRDPDAGPRAESIPPTMSAPPPRVPADRRSSGHIGQVDHRVSRFPPGADHGRASGVSRVAAHGRARLEDPQSSSGTTTSPAVLTPSVRLQGALRQLMERLARELDVCLSYESAFPAELQDTLDSLLADLDDEGALGADLDRRFLREAAISEAVGLGPLDRLLRNDAVRAVVVDGPARILADLGGGLSPVSSFFSSSEALRIIARRLLARAGESFSEDAVQRGLLPDGGQLLVLFPPLAVGGPLISVCRAANAPVVLEALVTEGRLSGAMLEFLQAAVSARQNILITGSADSGVSEFLSAMGGLVPDHERLVVVYGGPSVAVGHPHVVALNRQGLHGASMTELLAHAQSLRGDRLLLDDVRPQDALPVLTVTSTTRGSLMGMHAPSPMLALEQLQLFSQLALGQCSGSLAELLAHAVQVIVHLEADRDGARRVVTVAEVVGSRGEGLELRPMFRYDGTGFHATDHRPGFLTR
ncbi:MAG: ATPase, T2SS/T4P/T4SS family [Myxococcales bacterium]|nr:ATPase, T2SS/T4P/T4SS family [Myxococcales bacterium]